jgi:hypothetical protein
MSLLSAEITQPATAVATSTYRPGDDLLDAVLAALPPLIADAPLAWRRKHRTWVAKGIAAFRPADAVEAMFVGQIGVLRRLGGKPDESGRCAHQFSGAGAAAGPVRGRDDGGGRGTGAHAAALAEKRGAAGRRVGGGGFRSGGDGGILARHAGSGGGSVFPGCVERSDPRIMRPAGPRCPMTGSSGACLGPLLAGQAREAAEVREGGGDESGRVISCGKGSPACVGQGPIQPATAREPAHRIDPVGPRPGAPGDGPRGWRRGNPDLQLASRCGARARTTGCPCRAPAMANGRCRMHGGCSTGPVTPEGMTRMTAAQTTHGRSRAWKRRSGDM